MRPINILAIETSCDETSASICSNGKILSNIVSTQEIHQQYGGVVPELASRAHMQHIIPVVDAALQKAEITLKDLSAIAFTQSPGLIGALLVGAGVAKSMALALNIPLISVQHMHAHVLANLIHEPKPSFPFLCLTVSGGHTQIVKCSSPLEMEVIGKSRDDAAGEAYDKTAKLIGLPYPGGPLIDQYAAKGDPFKYSFPEPQIDGLDFSFSGIKTAILYFLKEKQKEDPNFVEKNLNDICASIQHRINSILLSKLKKAATQTGINEICMAGGVSANKGLRQSLQELGNKMNWNVYVPPFEFCTDNAGMIAITGHYKFLSGELAGLDISPEAR